MDPPGLIWKGAENLAHTEIRFPDRPPRSESLYRLCYLGAPWEFRTRAFVVVSVTIPSNVTFIWIIYPNIWQHLHWVKTDTWIVLNGFKALDMQPKWVQVSRNADFLPFKCFIGSELIRLPLIRFVTLIAVPKFAVVRKPQKTLKISFSRLKELSKVYDNMDYCVCFEYTLYVLTMRHIKWKCYARDFGIG